MKHSKEREKIEAFFENRLIVRKGFAPIDISKGIDWNHQHENNANTYQTYLHSLGIVNALIIISKADGNERLQKYARDIILNWYSIDHTKGNNHAWKEHPVSSRLNYILEFQKTSKNFKLPESLFEELVISHCDFLYNERNYRFNNHGLMMDYALLNAASFIKERDRKTMYVDKSLYRIRYALRRDFSRKGVHLENSPEYHRMVLVIFRKIERKLKELKTPLGKQETEILNLAQDYKNYVIQPNLLYPIIGDTGHIPDFKITKSFKDFYDSESGIAILNNKNNVVPENSTMLTFKSGYHSKTHKHYDDLSTTLFLDGKELLVDSGKYSYNSKDPVRQHIISPQGHNTICIKDESYKLTNPLKDQFSLKLLKLSKKKDYKLISGINKLYTDANLTRHNVLTKEKIYIVLDRVIGRDKIVSQQNFNINENATVNKLNKYTFEIIIEDETFILKTFKRHDAEIKSEIEKGYVSREFSKYVENRRIVLSQHSSNATFITAIFNKKNDEILDDVKLQNNKIIYTINGKNISIDL